VSVPQKRLSGLQKDMGRAAEDQTDFSGQKNRPWTVRHGTAACTLCFPGAENLATETAMMAEAAVAKSATPIAAVEDAY
jgi:hypothetical protein